MRKLERQTSGAYTLYVLVDSKDRIMAISEDEALMAKYVIQFSDYFTRNGSQMYVENSVKKIENLLIKGDLMTLQPFGNFVFTEMECQYYNAVFMELYGNYKNAVGELVSLNKLANLDEETSKSLNKGLAGVIEVLKSYDEFLDTLDTESVSNHILVKPYMAKFYYNEMEVLKNKLTHDLWRD